MGIRAQPTITIDTYRATLDALPRVQLANLPTPLDFCPRLTEHLGGPDIYIKRDDLTGLALGGNKTRNLEFLFGEAVAQGADCIITGAYPQSNQCRQTAAAAAKLGLDCYLVLGALRHRADVQGNLLLDHLFGAHVEVAPDADDVGVQSIIDERVAELNAEGRRPYRFTNKYPELAVKSVAGYLERHAGVARAIGAPAGTAHDHRCDFRFRLHPHRHCRRGQGFRLALPRDRHLHSTAESAAARTHCHPFAKRSNPLRHPLRSNS